LPLANEIVYMQIGWYTRNIERGGQTVIKWSYLLNNIKWYNWILYWWKHRIEGW